MSFNYSQPLQQEKSLEQLFQFLDKLGITIVIALDEFQQINMYPEKYGSTFAHYFSKT